MMSKRKILKGIEQQLSNLCYSKIDLELDNSIPPEMKNPVITNLKVKYSKLLEIRCNLKELLIG
jgi:hypothetical protein